MENRINSILELANDKKYVVLNQAVYQNKNYFLLARVTDDEQDVLNEIQIAEEVIEDGVLGIKVVTDPKLVELLAKYLELKV